METIVITGSELTYGICTLNETWQMSLSLEDEKFDLYLSAVLPMPLNDSLVYIFSNASRDVEYYDLVEFLPKSCRSLLLLSPMVPLMRTSSGFAAIHAEAWSGFVSHDNDISSEEYTYVGNTPAGTNDLEEDILSSRSESVISSLGTSTTDEDTEEEFSNENNEASDAVDELNEVTELSS